MRVASAVLHFNEGTAGLKRVFDNLNLNTVSKTVSSSAKKDKIRLRNMDKKNTSPVKKRRKQLRAIKKGLV